MLYADLAQATKAKPSMLILWMLEKVNPTRGLHTTLVDNNAPWISSCWMFVMIRLTSRV